MKQKRQQTSGHSPEKDWAERLRDHLADYEAPVPDDLWEKIEARLPKEVVAPKKKAHIVPLWARWTVAAAFVGAIVGSGIVLWPSGQEDITAPRASAEKAPASMKSEKSVESEPSSPSPLSPSIPNLKEKTLTLLAEEKPMESEKKASTAESPSTPSDPTEPIQPNESTQPNEPIESIEPVAPEKTPEDVIRELDQKIVAYKERRSRHAAINLYAANSFGNQSYRNGVLMSQEMLANYDYYTNPGSHGTRSGNSPIYLANHEERQKFYQPISFGLSVNFPISSEFSISTGAVYTRLRSDFTSIANSLVTERQQTLHYVGIPLTVQYNVWQWRGLNVYATAGGQADFNVKAQVTTEGIETKLEKDDLQWSVNAAAGVQYNFIPQLGIYVEPGVKHYFDNGSHIRNYFKHHPTNFNLQIGVRLNLRH